MNSIATTFCLCLILPTWTFGQIICQDGGECPTGNTCCPASGNKYKCCPFPNADCCSDSIHCCPQGYSCYSTNCVKSECSQLPNYCKNGGTCVDFNATSVECDCPQGYYGDQCQFLTTTTTQIDICTQIEPCQNGGTCLENGNTYYCICVSPYHGHNCTTGCSSDPCQGVPPGTCEHGGSCIGDADCITVHCICPAGWTGSNCQTSN